MYSFTRSTELYWHTNSFPFTINRMKHVAITVHKMEFVYQKCYADWVKKYFDSYQKTQQDATHGHHTLVLVHSHSRLSAIPSDTSISVQSLLKSYKTVVYSRNYTLHMTPEGSLPWSQQPARQIHTTPKFNIILPSTPRSSKWRPSFGFPIQNPAKFPSPKCVQYAPAHPILLDLITWITFGDKYKSWKDPL